MEHSEKMKTMEQYDKEIEMLKEENKLLRVKADEAIQAQLKQKEDFANVIPVSDPKDIVKNFFDWYDKTVWSQHKKRDFEKIYGCYLKDRK